MGGKMVLDMIVDVIVVFPVVPVNIELKHIKVIITFYYIFSKK